MITCRAPAKVNLNLLVTGRRDDGLHLIDSLAVFADLTDVLTIEKSETDQLILSGPFAEVLSATDQSDNLIMQALDRYRRATGWSQMLRIKLEKNIPVAAGIGGGSTDAATMLTAVNSLAGNRLGQDDLMRLGLDLGADVPVCLRAGQNPAWRMQGVGEIISEIDLSSISPVGEGPGLVLMNTGVEVSTAAVFTSRADRNTPYDPPAYYPDIMDQKSWDHLMGLGNSLTETASLVCPDLSQGFEYIRALAERGTARHYGMSGSGATFFAVFDTVAEARRSVDMETPPCWHWAGRLFEADGHTSKND